MDEETVIGLDDEALVKLFLQEGIKDYLPSKEFVKKYDRAWLCNVSSFFKF